MTGDSPPTKRLLDKILRESGVSQDRLAVLANIDPRILRSVQNGRELNLKTIERIAHSVGFDLQYELCPRGFREWA